MLANLASFITSNLSKWFANLSPAKSCKPDAPSHPPSSRMASLKSTDLAREDECHAIFRYFDINADGKISSNELRAYLALLGEFITVNEAEDVINEVDGDGDGLLDVRDFMKLMEGDVEDEDLLKAFEIFEAEKGSGYITAKSLQRTLNRIGEEKNYEECLAMLSCFDLDDNGVIDFHEFQLMMMMT